MRLSTIVLAATGPFSVGAIRIVLGNDDGWAEQNVRAFFDVLTKSGHDTILSCPAVNKSGRGSLDGPATDVEDGCQYNTCPKNSPPEGSDPSNPRINYLNSFPVSAMRHGAGDVASKIWKDGKAELIVAGPNVGDNAGFIKALGSGTIGVAVAAAAKLSTPGVAFSSITGERKSFAEQPTQKSALIYADAAGNFTNALIASGVPYLPPHTWLNVNFPAVGDGTKCQSAGDIKFVLSRIWFSLPGNRKDVETCGNGGRLPGEESVVKTDGCYASVSLGKEDKFDASAGDQEIVLNKLKSILTCLPKY